MQENYYFEDPAKVIRFLFNTVRIIFLKCLPNHEWIIALPSLTICDFSRQLALKMWGISSQRVAYQHSPLNLRFWRAGTGSRSFLCCQDPAQQWAELGEQQQPLSPVPCPQLPQGKPVYSGAPHHYKEGETSQAISMGGTDCPNSVSWALQDSGCAS